MTIATHILRGAAVVAALAQGAHADHWRNQYRDMSDWIAGGDPGLDPMMPMSGGSLPLAAGAPPAPMYSPISVPAAAPASRPPRARRYPREVIDRPALVPFGVAVA